MSTSRYHFETDNIDRTDWNNLIIDFSDATIYQTWEFAEGGVNRRTSSHVIMKRDKDIVACCQISLRKVPILQLSIADIKWAPLCMKRDKPYDNEIMIKLISFIKEEYAIKKGHILRIWPHIIGNHKDHFLQILQNNNFVRNNSERPYRTFYVDLTPPEKDIRNNFLQKWRNCLNKSEKNGLRVSNGTGDDLFLEFMILAKEMVARKNLAPSYMPTFNNFRRLQNNLPEHLKMQILICRYENEPIAATIYSALGDTGIYLLGASGANGLKTNASYLIQWNMIKQMKMRGIKKI